MFPFKTGEPADALLGRRHLTLLHCCDPQSSDVTPPLIVLRLQSIDRSGRFSPGDTAQSVSLSPRLLLLLFFFFFAGAM